MNNILKSTGFNSHDLVFLLHLKDHWVTFNDFKITILQVTKNLIDQKAAKTTFSHVEEKVSTLSPKN